MRDCPQQQASHQVSADAPAPLLQQEHKRSLQPKLVQKPCSNKWDDFIQPDMYADTDTQLSPSATPTSSCKIGRQPLQAVGSMPAVHVNRAQPAWHTSPLATAAVHHDAVVSPVPSSSLMQQHRSNAASHGASGPAHTTIMNQTSFGGTNQPGVSVSPHQNHSVNPIGLPAKSSLQQQHAPGTKPGPVLSHCRQGFKPPAFTAPLHSKAKDGCNSVSGHSRGQAAAGAACADPLLSFFGQASGPVLRHVAVPTSFDSLQHYKQVWCSAVTEELSIRSMLSTTPAAHCLTPTAFRSGSQHTISCTPGMSMFDALLNLLRQAQAAAPMDGLSPTWQIVHN